MNAGPQSAVNLPAKAITYTYTWMQFCPAADSPRSKFDANAQFAAIELWLSFSQSVCPWKIALMHVTSWSESYPLRNSLMGVRGFRPVISSVSFVFKRPALERQSQGMRSFSPPKTTSVGRLFEGETLAH